MSDELQTALKNVSKVNGNAKLTKIKSQLVWLVVFIITAIICVMLLMGNKRKAPQNNLASDQSFLDAKTELNSNLAKLNANSPKKPTALSVSLPTLSPPPSSEETKAELVRQNAPTDMFNAIPEATNRSVAASSAQQTTLSDQSSNTQFANQVTVVKTVKAKTLSHPNFTVAQGEFIHAVLETAINSNLPGMVRAIISEPVYAYRGEHLLIPAGSRLIGQYNSAVVQGQNRVMVMWNRVILPNGISVELDSPGTDALGEAGQAADNINRHFFARFGNAALLSIIGAGAATLGVSSNDQYNSASMYRAALAQSFQQSANQALKQDNQIGPTLTIQQGAKINVFVAQDVSFYQVLRGETA